MSKSKAEKEARYIERLEQVVRVLKELPKKNKFNLDYWVYGPRGELTKEMRATCNTSACAIGWAASDPWFIKRGFYLKLNSFYALEEDEDEVELHPVYRYATNDVDSVLQFFGINNEEEEYLFMPHTYVRGNRADVWRRIEKYVKRRKEGFRVVYVNECSNEPVWAVGL